MAGTIPQIKENFLLLGTFTVSRYVSYLETAPHCPGLRLISTDMGHIHRYEPLSGDTRHIHRYGPYLEICLISADTGHICRYTPLFPDMGRICGYGPYLRI
jgi:hypothetical protein